MVLVSLTAVGFAQQAAAQDRGVQDTPDGARRMINTSVGPERWAITRHPTGILTGNVFRVDGGPPSFIACTPLAVENHYTCQGGDGCLAPESAPGSSPRGVSNAPVGNLTMVNKDVGSERWAITLNEDGSLTGNVYRADGGPDSFIFCEPSGSPDGFRCYGAGACDVEPCGQSFYSLIGEVTLPAGFLERPSPCSDSYEVIAPDIDIDPVIFEPPTKGPTGCGDIFVGGSWNLTETVDGSCCVAGQCQDISGTGDGSVVLQQEGCRVFFEVPVMGMVVRREGEIEGDQITLAGILGIVIPGANLTENQLVLSGTIASDTEFTMQGTGRLRGTASGVAVACDVEASSEFTR